MCSGSNVPGRRSRLRSSDRSDCPPVRGGRWSRLQQPLGPLSLSDATRTSGRNAFHVQLPLLPCRSPWLGHGSLQFPMRQLVAGSRAVGHRPVMRSGAVVGNFSPAFGALLFCPGANSGSNAPPPSPTKVRCVLPIAYRWPCFC